MNDEEMLALMRQHRPVFEIWLNGYQAGLIGGRTDQRLEDEQIAHMAARLAVAQVLNQADIRDTIKCALQFIEVDLARDKTRLANLNRPDSRRSTWEPADPGGAR